MNTKIKVTLEINKLKAGLTKKAKYKGQYSYFGQKEVKKMKKKYANNEDTNDKILNLITDFSKWCKDFKYTNLRGS